MRKIIKKSTPSRLEEYIKNLNPQDHLYRPTYEGLDSDTREQLQKSLLDEQGGVCAYCMQKISSSIMKIEHHCEQSICNGKNGSTNRTLDYNNMHAVCLGVGGRNDLHCDSKKSQFDIKSGLPMNISPLISAHMSSITYSSTGLLSSTVNGFDKEINVILNLNAKHLKDLRGGKFRKIYSLSKNAKPAIRKAKMKRLLETDLQKAGDHFSNSFPGMSEYMLQKFV